MRLTLCSGPQKSKGFSLLEVMVSISILGIALVTLFQLFSISLRSVKKSEDYSIALIHARSIMDEAYALPKLSAGSESFDFEGGFKGIRTVSSVSSRNDLKPSEEKIKAYEITVTVSWPPSGKLELKGLKTYYEAEE